MKGEQQHAASLLGLPPIPVTDTDMDDPDFDPLPAWQAWWDAMDMTQRHTFVSWLRENYTPSVYPHS